MKAGLKKVSEYPLITQGERMSVWEKGRGMWKHRNPAPDKELKGVRKEWERKLSASPR